MKIINKSRKIISIVGEALLPSKGMELPEGLENHPAIKYYMDKGIIADVEKAVGIDSTRFSEFERTKIAEEAIAQYKAEQIEKEAEIRAVKAMKKDLLLTKAAGMGIEIADGETADSVRDKILEVLNQ